MHLLVRNVLSFLVALVLLYYTGALSVDCVTILSMRVNRNCLVLFFKYLLQTSLYSDKLLAGKYFNKFTITCMFYILYRIENREPA